MLRKLVAIIFVAISRISVVTNGYWTKFKLSVKGVKVGRKLKVIGNFNVLGWYNNIHIGDNVDIHNNCRFIVGRDGHISIGDRTSISYNTIINAGIGSIHIGKNTMLAGNCYVISNDHNISESDSVRDSGHVVGDVRIGDNVWIGANVVVTKGVTIGDGAIIGAGSVVTKDIQPMMIAVGNPCREIKKRVLVNDKK